MYRPLFLVFTAALWVTAGASAAAAPSDYLSDELRARVQTLKVDALIAPTDLVNVKSRLRTLWDWLNAYALSGGYVPVNATQSISQISAYPLTPTNNRFTTIDRMIQEFVLRDENPRAFGTLVANLGPFEARTFVTIEQTFTVGTKAIEASMGSDKRPIRRLQITLASARRIPVSNLLTAPSRCPACTVVSEMPVKRSFFVLLRVV